jgi:hypothetical protein
MKKSLLLLSAAFLAISSLSYATKNEEDKNEKGQPVKKPVEDKKGEKKQQGQWIFDVEVKDNKIEISKKNNPKK